MVEYMNNKNTTPKKKTPAKKKTSPTSVKRVEIDVTTDDVKDLVAGTFAELQRNNFKVNDKVKKGLFARVKSWFKVS